MKRSLALLTLLAAPALLADPCPFAVDLVSPRTAYHKASANAELVAPSATATVPGRRRPSNPPSNPQGSLPRVNFIDTDLFSKMDKDGVVPTGLAGDAEFLRRVTLDLTGQIPDAATVTAFLSDTASDKRTKKIDELLASDAFNDRWTMWFGDLVQNVQFSTAGREYYLGRNVYYTFIRDSIRNAKPYDQFVRELLAGKGDSFAVGQANYWVRQIQNNGPIQDTYDNLAAHSGEKFLGQPLLCLSCHSGLGHLELVNGYLKSKARSDFWGMAAFFATTRARPVVADPAMPNIRKFDVADFPNGSYQLNTDAGNKTARAPVPGGASIATAAYMFTGEKPRAGEPLRDAYGRMLTADRQFARTAVNQLWKEMFGVGLVEPLNAFDLSKLDTQPSNPALLEDLTTEFIRNGYSLRGILRTMAVSSAYQLSSTYTPGPWSETWTPYFARHYPHRLTAEAMLDAVAKATSVPVAMNVQGMGVVTRAMLLPDPLEGRRSTAGLWLDEFGRGDRDDSARTNDSSISQALSLMNNTIVTTRVKRATANSTVSKVLASTTDPGSIVDQLYLATLSRKPTADERTQAIAYLGTGTLATKTEDLQFVLLNQLEFLFD
ncbi:MAG TPA: DUF1549 domain-containing protein [Thermoanaerobaculia bacterium]|nr:DUF1549 domain-containing protein [Thermoanaerobaculia bacterium]